MASDVQELRRTFEERCREARVPAQFVAVEGGVQEELLRRATWSDLVVAPLIVSEQGTTTLSAGFRSFLRRSPRPILTVQDEATPLSNALLAYDGGNRADAALFVAAYIVLKWTCRLTVLTVGEAASFAGSPLERARTYLTAHGVAADYVQQRGRVGEVIVHTAEERGCDVILMGSYQFNRWLETVLGGVLEDVLRLARVPVLVV